MVLRLFVTIVLLAFAVGAFFGAGPTTVRPSPFGIFFLGVAILVWFAWKPMRAGLGTRTGIWDAFVQNNVERRERKTSSDRHLL